MKISNEVVDVLDRCRVEGQVVKLPEQLDRKLYEAVTKVLVLLGGKWDKKLKGHLFPNDPSENLDNTVLAGEIVDAKKEYQFFETPDALAERMVKLADIQPDDYVLEPSAGMGAIAKFISRIPRQGLTLVELNKENHFFLVRSKLAEVCSIIRGDFLNAPVPLRFFNKIIMNPPFSKQQDIDHVMRAWDLSLCDGGRIVAIMSEGAFLRKTKKSESFQALLAAHGTSEVLPSGTFKESGTMVASRLVILDK